MKKRDGRKVIRICIEPNADPQNWWKDLLFCNSSSDLLTLASGEKWPTIVEKITKFHVLKCWMFSFPYGSVLNPDPYGIQICIGSGSIFSLKCWIRIRIKWIRIRNPEKKVGQYIFFYASLLLLFLDPGSGMDKNQDRGPGIDIPDPQHCL